MDSIQYIGEHLLPGKLGQAFNVLAFVAALFSSVSYFFAVKDNSTNKRFSWKNMGRIGFYVHGISIFALIGTIFYIMLQQYFEYQYVQQHVSEDLPLKYIFSAFWEGQEGSFLLWMFWNVILGFVLIRTTKDWESPVLSMMAAIQLILCSMILGVHIGFGENIFKLGSSPVLLLRDVFDAPIFRNADYISLIEGSGLNPLLQNYWMTIHPPTLFLGFSSTLVPFLYAIAALWTKRYKAWLKPVLPWALFSGAILGLGILMGGAWAYEALSFGGYWAWDPVENMSLVPWLILIAGIHTNLIAKSTGHAIRANLIFYILTFFLVVYSTFLTRSGVLGDTSVHSFTEMGLEWQLIFYMLFIGGVGFFLLMKNWKEIPSPEKEESLSSREFWMFIGSLVLLFSGILISFTTSIPVFNKIFDGFGWIIGKDMSHWHRSAPLEPIEHYNRFQIWIAVFIMILSSAGQFLRYKGLNWQKKRKSFWIRMLVSAVLAVILTLISLLVLEANAWQYKIITFAAYFSIFANLDYLIFFLKFKGKSSASVLGHAGFAIMIIGILFSGLNKEYISSNPFAQEGLVEDFKDRDRLQKNILLLEDEPIDMKEYEVVFSGDTLLKNNRYFNVDFKKLNSAGLPSNDSFSLTPYIIYEKDFSKIASSNPSIRRYWNRDIFTHIKRLPPQQMEAELAKQVEDSLVFETYNLSIRDSILTESYTAVLTDIDFNPKHADYIPEEGDLAVGAELTIQEHKSAFTEIIKPVIVLRGNLLLTFPVQVNDFNLKLRLKAESFDNLVSAEELLTYEKIMLKSGEQVSHNGLTFSFSDFSREIEHPDYIAEDADIAVAANISILDPASGNSFEVKPVYLIRGKQPYSLKDYAAPLGIHIRFASVDPETGVITLEVAKEESQNRFISIDIAENVPRDDYIVLEAIKFPGINLFWLGSLMMLIGLGLGMSIRLKGKKRT